MSIGPDGTSQPTPHPSTWQTGIVHMPDGSAMVQIIVMHAAGATIIFLDPETAQTIGGQIRKTGKQAATGLIVPGGALVSPNGHAISSGQMTIDEDDE